MQNEVKRWTQSERCKAFYHYLTRKMEVDIRNGKERLVEGHIGIKIWDMKKFEQ